MDGLAIGALVRWSDGSCPHVGRIVEVDGDEAVVRYGPITASIPTDRLHPVAEKDGRGQLRGAA